MPGLDRGIHLLFDRSLGLALRFPRMTRFMEKFLHLPPLAEVIARHGLFTKKALGQHFLLNEAITDRIVQYAGDVRGHHIIEIGPGPGGLTRSLLKAGAGKVTAIEMDDRAIAILEELKTVAGDRLEIIHGDALKIDITAISSAPRKIVANLPYNVGTQLLVNWLEQIYSQNISPRLRGELEGGESKNSAHPHLTSPASGGGNSPFKSMTLMFQKEVAERIVAEHGNKAYGRLSVFAQWLTEVRWDMDLPPGAFSPPPKVSSAVITLTPRATPLVDVSKDALEKVLASAFNQRRKMLRGSLKTLGVDTEKLLFSAGIDGTLRAEQLDVVTLCGLAKIYDKAAY